MLLVSCRIKGCAYGQSVRLADGWTDARGVLIGMQWLPTAGLSLCDWMLIAFAVFQMRGDGSGVR